MVVLTSVTVFCFSLFAFADDVSTTTQLTSAEQEVLVGSAKEMMFKYIVYGPLVPAPIALIHLLMLTKSSSLSIWRLLINVTTKL